MRCDARAANVRVLRSVDCSVRNQVLSFPPGDHLVPEPVADRLVAAGVAERLLPRGKRLKSALRETPR